jgi:hypothetical protein
MNGLGLCDELIERGVASRVDEGHFTIRIDKPYEINLKIDPGNFCDPDYFDVVLKPYDVKITGNIKTFSTPTETIQGKFTVTRKDRSNGKDVNFANQIVKVFFVGQTTPYLLCKNVTTDNNGSFKLSDYNITIPKTGDYFIEIESLPFDVWGGGYYQKPFRIVDNH